MKTLLNQTKQAYEELVSSKKPFSEMIEDEKYVFLLHTLSKTRPFLNPNDPSGLDKETLAYSLKMVKEAVLFMFVNRKQESSEDKMEDKIEKIIDKLIQKKLYGRDAIKQLEEKAKAAFAELLANVEATKLKVADVDTSLETQAAALIEDLSKKESVPVVTASAGSIT